MKRLVTILLTLVIPVSMYAQGKNIETYKTSIGWEIHKGDIVSTGIGSKGEKKFSYITTSPLSLAGFDYMNSMWSNMKFTVKGIKKYKLKLEEKYYLVLNSGTPINWWCEIESAIAVNEIITPRKYQLASPVATASIADELKKLDELRKQEIITEEEFSAQKKKLLEK